MRVFIILILSLIVSIYLLTLTGCTNKYRPIIIETPPNRIAIAGELDEQQREVFYNALKIMVAQPYREHTYNHPMGASMHQSRSVSESESNSLTVNRGD